MKGTLIFCALFLFSFYLSDATRGPTYIRNEFGFDGTLDSKNASGQLTYEEPSANALCFYQAHDPHVDSKLFMPDDFTMSLYGYPINNSIIFWFYDAYQVHWGVIFNMGKFSSRKPSSRKCVEVLGTAPNRRVVFTWDGFDDNELVQLKLLEIGEVEFNLIRYNGVANCIGIDSWNYMHCPVFGMPSAVRDGTAFRYHKGVFTTGSIPVTTMAPGGCVAGTSKCTPNGGNSYQTCNFNVWQPTQYCQPGLVCYPNGAYVYCGWPTTPPPATQTSGSGSQPVTTASVPSVTTGSVPPAQTTGSVPPSVTTGLDSSSSCTFGATRCNGANTFQTCVYQTSTTVGWGSSQTCEPGTRCVQYGTTSNTYVGCAPN